MVINLSSTQQLSTEVTTLREGLATDGHLLVRGLFSKEEIYQVREAFENVYQSLEPRGTTGVKPAEIINNDLLKYSVGQNSGAQTLARLFLILYRNDETLTAAEKKVFDKLVQIWEILQGRSFTAEEMSATNTFFAKRYQYYPVGGGFMGTHADVVAADASKNLGSEYIQFVLPITQKGVDYKEGGGYIIVDGKMVPNENNIETGDIVVYDGAIEHGVADIDSDQPLVIDGKGGRIVMFITLYKKMA